MTGCAICTRDLPLFNAVIPSMNFRDILSHEKLSGFVEVGAGVHNLTVGDRVVVPLTISCIDTVPERLALGRAETLGFMKDDMCRGLLDEIALAPAINKGLALKMSQTPAQRCLAPQLERIEKGEIGPSFVIWHVVLRMAQTCIGRFGTKKMAA